MKKLTEYRKHQDGYFAVYDCKSLGVLILDATNWQTANHLRIVQVLLYNNNDHHSALQNAIHLGKQHLRPPAGPKSPRVVTSEET